MMYTVNIVIPVTTPVIAPPIVLLDQLAGLIRWRRPSERDMIGLPLNPSPIDPELRGEQASELFSQPPAIENIDVLAAKLP